MVRLPILLAVLTLLTIVSMPDAEANFSIYSRHMHGTTYVRLSDVARYYGMHAWRSGQEVVVYGNGKRIDLTLDRREAKINQLVVHLSFAPVLHEGRVMIGERDFTLLIDPILRDWSLPAFRVRRIAIDAGHGGKDDGAKGARLKEKELTLKMARRLKSLLEGKGYEVVLIRDDDRFIELEERPKRAAQLKADLFISVHFNAVATKSVHGIETFVLTPQHTPSTPSSKPRDKAVPGNRWDKQNHRLGFEIHRYLIANTRANDRGLKRMQWAVLRTAPCPAVLLELGFLTNSEEERRVGSAGFQEKLAIAITNGIISYDRVGYENSLRNR